MAEAERDKKEGEEADEKERADIKKEKQNKEKQTKNKSLAALPCCEQLYTAKKYVINVTS